MFLSAERTALANRTVLHTFEQTSVAWQAIPHWDTGDPGQTRIRGDVSFAFTPKSGTSPPADPVGGDPIPIDLIDVQFRIRLGQATADTPDAMLASVLAQTVELARLFDEQVLARLGDLHRTEPEDRWRIDIAEGVPESDCESRMSGPARRLLAALIDGRGALEDSGYRADSCLIASTAHYKAVYQPAADGIVVEDLLRAASVNSVYRASQLDLDGHATAPRTENRSLLLGRRQEIAHRCGGQASPGEEPIDLAVSVPPSLEIVGDTASGYLDLGLRVRYALRVKDPRGIVVFYSEPESGIRGITDGSPGEATT